MKLKLTNLMPTDPSDCGISISIVMVNVDCL
nr:MAG TPA: hypothetical protein [Caudoviricetes sp.]